MPVFAPGDTLRVAVKVVEGERSRVQNFEGVCIARSNKGLNSNFTVRKISYGEGVERVFPLYAPTIAEIAVVRRGDVRRAKLYYLRGRRGKSARIAEKARVIVPGDRAPRPRSRRPAGGRRRSKSARGDDEGGRQKCPERNRGRCSTRSGTAMWCEQLPDGTCILYIDRHLVHEVTSPQAFEGLRMAGRPVRRPDATIAVADHNIPTVGSRVPRHRGGGQPHPGRDAGAQRRRVRRALHPDPR